MAYTIPKREWVKNCRKVAHVIICERPLHVFVKVKKSAQLQEEVRKVLRKRPVEHEAITCLLVLLFIDDSLRLVTFTLLLEVSSFKVKKVIQMKLSKS